MEIYLDNSATTRPFAVVRDTMIQTLDEDFGNPSSLHRKGMEAEAYIRQAKARIAATLKVEEKEIFFTSGGTEANNLAILGGAAANYRAGRHLITTSIEHPSVLNPMRHLEEQGYSVTYLPVDRQGQISPEDLAGAMTPGTILVSVMMVNNEIGAREPVEEIGKLLKEKWPAVLFHVDAVQGYGKYRIRPRNAGIDLLSVSGHKIHGPKGAGFLYVKDKVKIKPILFGGDQQKGLRSGTENVPGIAGLGVAAEAIHKDLEGHNEQMYALRERFWQGLQEIPEVYLNGPAGREGAPHVISAGFAGIRSEVLLHALEDKGICVSSGSACSSHHAGASSTLEAIRLDPKLADCTLRFSLSMFTTEEETDAALQALKELVPFLRRFKRR